MDLLQKEMQRKRQALAKAKMGGDGGPRKYMRNADIRRVEEEEEEEEQRQKLALAGKRARDAESEMNRHNQTRSDGTLSSAKKKIKKNRDMTPIKPWPLYQQKTRPQKPVALILLPPLSKINKQIIMAAAKPKLWPT